MGRYYWSAEIPEIPQKTLLTEVKLWKGAWETCLSANGRTLAWVADSRLWFVDPLRSIVPDLMSVLPFDVVGSAAAVAAVARNSCSSAIAGVRDSEYLIEETCRYYGRISFGDCPGMTRVDEGT